MQKITTCLWFDNQAEDAANFYCSIFNDSKILKIARYGDAGPGPAGSVMTVEFQLEGQKFLGLNGGPYFTFTPAISLIVDCTTQEEVDAYWNRLSAVKEAEQCGWLKDKFGLSWQIVPRTLVELASDPDPVKSQRVMQAMLQMKKLDIAALKKAHAG
ncbi:MAG TPA: VOC family protein [Gammaproteobacteria bacterium]